MLQFTDSDAFCGVSFQKSDRARLSRFSKWFRWKIYRDRSARQIKWTRLVFHGKGTTTLYIVNRLCACTRSVFLRAIIPLFDFTGNGRDAASNIAGDETFSAP